MKSVLLSAAFFFIANVYAQPSRKNLVIVTIDGVRWQEVFAGADSSILFSGKYLSQDSVSVVKKYWNDNAHKSREMIFPFLWQTIAKQGQVYGNRNYGNTMQVKNRYWFSYPGYNEIFSGYPDTLINSNDYPANPHEHLLSFLNRQPGYKNKVVAFTNWTAFERILNGSKHGILVSSGNKPLPEHILETNPELQVLNDIQIFMPSLWETDRLDGLTYGIAKGYIKSNHPKIVYVSFGETDEWAHSGKYDFYLDAANKADAMLNDLWKTIQADAFYKNNTYLLVTTDHGRGIGSEWTSHNAKIKNSNETWMAVMGPGISIKGEMKNAVNLTSSQLAQTMAFLLGFKFIAAHPVDEKMKIE